MQISAKIAPLSIIKMLMNINLIILLKINLYNIVKQIFIYLIKLLQHCYINPIEISMYSICNNNVIHLTLS